jgi:hypothetical protein
MLMVAAMPAYKLNWTLSPDDLLMISVGTGLHRMAIDRQQKADLGILSAFLTRERREDIQEAAFAAKTLRTVVADSALFSLKAMQCVSNPRFSWKINSEVGSFEGQLLLKAVADVADHHDARGILRFQRYDLPLETGGLVPPEFDVAATQMERMALQAIDDPKTIDRLDALAAEAALKQVSIADFEGFL